MMETESRMDPAAGAKEALPKRGFLLALLLALAAILAILPPAYSESLQVTPEHPFLLNGSWVEAQDLQTGDLLYTLDGQQVRITNIIRIVPKSPPTVYNLEAGFFHDFVVGPLGLVVHNSNRIIRAPQLQGSRIIKLIDPDTGSIHSIVEVSDFSQITHNDYNALMNFASKHPEDVLVDQTGQTRIAFLIDDQANLADLPQNLRGAIPSGRRVVAKVIRPTPTGFSEKQVAFLDFEDEILVMETINEECIARGMKPFFPENTYYWSYETSPVYRGPNAPGMPAYGNRGLQGTLVQDIVPESSLAEIFRRLDDLASTPRGQILKQQIIANKATYQTKLDELFKKTGVILEDMHNQNLAVGFEHAGSYMTLEDVLTSNMPIEEITFYFRAYEAGGAGLTSAGKGAISFVDYINPIL